MRWLSCNHQTVITRTDWPVYSVDGPSLLFSICSASTPQSRKTLLDHISRVFVLNKYSVRGWCQEHVNTLAAADEQEDSSEQTQQAQTCFVDRASSLCMLVLGPVVASSERVFCPCSRDQAGLISNSGKSAAKSSVCGRRLRP